MKKITVRQWIKFGVASILYILFSIWMENGWLLLGLIAIVDIFLTGYIPWGAWRRTKNPALRTVLSWVDDILFALVVVYLINLFLVQNYQIPSSSLEKTLLVGDYLVVSKLSYGPRVPNTPLSFPLVQNTFPVINCKSYVEWPRWPYKRVKGLGQIKRNEIVVFNFPAGDTVALLQQNPDYYTLIEMAGRQRIHNDKATFGEILYRPVDKRENFVKRCVGLPGDTLAIRNNRIYIDGKESADPLKVQFNYFVETNGSLLSESLLRSLGISRDDRTLLSEQGGFDRSNLFAFLGILPDSITGNYHPVYRFPLTNEALEKIKRLPEVTQVLIEPDVMGGDLFYPVGHYTGWSRDNYGPVWIPAKGASVELNETTLALYGRCIVNYENNRLEVKQGTAYINGEPSTSYTFKYDYYFMMGDNRHGSADSRSWGFVPEDHIIGRPVMVWFSVDKDRPLLSGGIRWDRMFRMVHAD